MKKVIQRILFATDFSQCSSHAFQFALSWSEACVAELHIIHVLGPYTGLDIEASVTKLYVDEQQKISRTKLDDLLMEAKTRVPATSTQLVCGMPSDQISEYAVDYHADLVITGTHGWTGLDRILLGSIAERVVRQSPCPVMTVRYTEGATQKSENHTIPPSKSEDDKRLTPHHLLIPIDFSECSLNAYEYGVQVAKCYDASVTLLHALEPLSYSLDFNLTHPVENKEYRQKVESRLSEFSDVLKNQGLRADYQLRDKPASSAIPRTLSAIQADMIVMGTHGRGGFSRLEMGSVAEAVLRQSPYPVLTVKGSETKRLS